MFKALPRYIFSQTTGPFIIVTLVLTGIIWLTQTLKLLDLIVIQGQSVVTFGELSMLAMPSVLNIVLPISLFCALIYALNQMITDSEMVVMFAAGLSRWRIAQPVLLLTGLIVLLVLALNLYLMPAGMRVLKDKLFQIRGDVLASAIREGSFSNPTAGVTVYVRDRTPSGEVRGILVQDNRDVNQAVTYMATNGNLVRTPEGPRLIMYNGNIQRATKERGEQSFTFMHFDSYTYDLSQYAQGDGEEYYESRERFLGEMFNPDPKDAYANMFRSRLRAEGHDRLVAALYPVMFAMVALAILLPAPFSRRGYASRIVIGVSIAVVARIIGFGLINAAVENPWVIPLIYLIPLLICAGSAMHIGGLDGRWFARYFGSRLAMREGGQG